ncbi:cell wall protein [Enterococcus termitis]|uniref:Cell wall protein n=1 Tax=Enterococcus termitis TaxID=332950 RepID=A0A1E5GJL9_9ENTE|nr:cell wall protein [Enterococcus termitis]OEG12440.1 cell wall protein [Enterococcus termitis]OJG98727.1 LPXTG-domain-containing protein cell wall anchor domain [Enterococcus termitis]
MMLKRIRTQIVILSLVFIGSFFTVKPVVSYGAEAEVQTVGEIVFSEESTTPTSGTSQSSSDEEPTKKPAGKFPSTGELVQKSLLICGMAVIVLVACFYLFKRKQTTRRKEGQNQ